MISFERESYAYILEQVKNMLPIIIALMFLAVLTIVSCTSILVRQSLYKYGVFYLNGLTWKECMRLQKNVDFYFGNLVFGCGMGGIGSPALLWSA